MFIARTLKKLKVSARNLFLEKHQLGTKKMKKNEKLVLISACLAKAQVDKPTIEQAAIKVNMEENVDLHDGKHDEETGDDNYYDSVHADDTDYDANEYDGRSKDHDVVLQEVGCSSEEEEDDDDDEQEVYDDLEGEFCSRVGQLVTTFWSQRFFGDSDLSGMPMFPM